MLVRAPLRRKAPKEKPGTGYEKEKGKRKGRVLQKEAPDARLSTSEKEGPGREASVEIGESRGDLTRKEGREGGSRDSFEHL